MTLQDEPNAAGVPYYAPGRHLCNTSGNLPFREPGP